MRQLSVVKNEPYKGLYKAALQNTDSVARFMFLCSILFDVLNAAGQSDVDNHIRCLAVYDINEDRSSTRNPNKKETIFTRLLHLNGLPIEWMLRIHRMINDEYGHLSVTYSG